MQEITWNVQNLKLQRKFFIIIYLFFCIITVFTFDDDDGGDEDHQICKCINFFVSHPIFFNDPSKFAYCKTACRDEARFLILGLGGRQNSKNTLFLTFLSVFRL